MKNIKAMVVKAGTKMILNEKDEISLAKLGGNIMALAGVVLAMPSMGFEISVDVSRIATLVLALGGAMGWNGMRDALGKK